MTSLDSKSSFLSFPKLKEPDRFSQWSLYLKTYLQGEGLWEYVNSDTPEPHPATLDPVTKVYIKPSLGDKDKKVQKEWEQNDTKTRSKILQMLDESHFIKFGKYTTAREMWKALYETFEDSSTHNVLLWWLELTQTRVEDGDLLQPHFDHILEAAQKLEDAGFTVPEPLLVMVILVTLPSAYEQKVTSLHTALTTSSPTDRSRYLTTKFVTDCLLEHECMLVLQASVLARV